MIDDYCQSHRPWATVKYLMIAFSIVNLQPSIVNAISRNAGTKNGDFLNLGTDARGVALGDSGVSTVEGIDALRWNPAGLSALTTKEAGGTHIQYYQSVHVENVGFAYPLGDDSA